LKKTRIAMFSLAIAAMTVSTATSAFATAPPDHKVGICHRTGSETNPYVFIVVDVASLDAHFNVNPGHPPKDGREDFYANSAEDCSPYGGY
jgi:hypothetical protein